MRGRSLKRVGDLYFVSEMNRGGEGEEGRGCKLRVGVIKSLRKI